MRSIKERLMQKIEQTMPDSSLFGFERSEYLTNVQSMHGGLARGSLSNYFDACCVGNKRWFEEFLPRTIQLYQTSVELKVDGGWNTNRLNKPKAYLNLVFDKNDKSIISNHID